MLKEKEVRSQLKCKEELRARGHDRVTDAILEGWINALKFVLEELYPITK